MVELKKKTSFQITINTMRINNYYTRSYLNIHTFTPLKRKIKIKVPYQKQ